MKTSKSKTKQIGVWMDHASAKLIQPDQHPDTICVFNSNQETRNRTAGESADGTRLGNFRSTNNEHVKHEKEQNEMHTYYKQLAKEIKPYDEIFVFGPTTAHNEFHNFLMKEGDFKGKKIFSESSDYITDNQLHQKVKHFFETNIQVQHTNKISASS